MLNDLKLEVESIYRICLVCHCKKQKCNSEMKMNDKIHGGKSEYTVELDINITVYMSLFSWNNITD